MNPSSEVSKQAFFNCRVTEFALGVFAPYGLLTRGVPVTHGRVHGDIWTYGIIATGFDETPDRRHTIT
ncbi:unnamed protein product, partial [Dicrocoelium dendriticum]